MEGAPRWFFFCVMVVGTIRLQGGVRARRPAEQPKSPRAGHAGFRGAGGKFPLFSLSETLPAHGAEFANKWRFLTYVSGILATSEFLFCFISAKFMEMVLTQEHLFSTVRMSKGNDCKGVCFCGIIHHRSCHPDRRRGTVRTLLRKSFRAG